MAKIITREGFISSVKIDKDFLVSACEIIESESYKKYESEKPQESVHPFTVRYRITTNDKDKSISFSSLDELKRNKFFPTKIKSISLGIDHYDSEYVDIDIKMGEVFVMFSNGYQLSSSNEASLLKIENDLEKLFLSHRNKYASLIYWSGPQISYTNLVIIQ